MIRMPSGVQRSCFIRSLMVLSLLTLGCRAKDVPPPLVQPRPVIPTHRGVAPPPAPSAQALWVALADHLGRSPESDASPVPLQLTSAGPAPLRLSKAEDSDGPAELVRATTLLIRWRRTPLPAPLTISRLVAGPFASFESAERVAQRWRAKGARAQVAHPDAWEVWLPADAPPLPDVSLRTTTQTITTVVTPSVQTPAGDRLETGPLLLDAPDGLRWQGGVMRGPFRLQPDAYGTWTLLEQVPLERYLEGVVPHEIGAGSPPAALEAQAVLARTWALANSHRFRLDGYHLCSDTQCQVYSDPRHASPSVRQAIKATEGQVLLWQGKPFSAVYHASNGGVMASAPEAWAMAPAAYLRSRPDGDARWLSRWPLPLDSAAVNDLLQEASGVYGAGHPLFRWQRTYSAAQLQTALADPGLGAIRDLKVMERGPSGRALRLSISGDGPDSPVILRLDAIRRRLRRLPSTLFVIQPAGPGLWQFQGGGFGHGAGLSQAGAIDLARRGWSLKRILSHYYPGATLAPVSPAGKAP